MRLVCSYCRKSLGEKEPKSNDKITHGMCVDCFAYYDRQWSGQKLSEYLDTFDVPVVAVNPDGRLIAANRRMAKLLGKTPREMFGLLGGEAMECQYARLPGGCGRTSHCYACTVRQTVMATMQSGEPGVRVPAYLNQEDQRLRLLISTYREGDCVRLVVEEISVADAAQPAEWRPAASVP
ncbi:MAG: hypothetical protein C4523_15395 [Myxococcales bacterium]|nr:MAG: hypothetical protein C4523_15395 [Myxococcales bacterium]